MSLANTPPSKLRLLTQWAHQHPQVDNNTKIFDARIRIIGVITWQPLWLINVTTAQHTTTVHPWISSPGPTPHPGCQQVYESTVSILMVLYDNSVVPYHTKNADWHSQLTLYALWTVTSTGLEWESPMFSYRSVASLYFHWWLIVFHWDIPILWSKI